MSDESKYKQLTSSEMISLMGQVFKGEKQLSWWELPQKVKEKIFDYFSMKADSKK